MRASCAVCSAPHRRRRTAAGPIVGEGRRIGSPERGDADRRPTSGRAPNERCHDASNGPVTCASNMNSKPHLGRQRVAPPRFLSLLTASARCDAGSAFAPAATRSRARLRLSSSLRVSASLARSASSAPDLVGPMAPQGVRKRRPPRSRHHLKGDNRGGRAGCPNATQPEPFTVSTFFIRPPAGNWQARFVGFGRNGWEFRLAARRVVLAFKFRLTTRP